MKVDELQGFVVAELGPRMERLDLTSADVTPDLDLFSAGLVDSMGFMELLAAIEKRFGVEIDLDGVDPETLYSIEGLARHVNRPG